MDKERAAGGNGGVSGQVSTVLLAMAPFMGIPKGKDGSGNGLRAAEGTSGAVVAVVGAEVAT